MTLILMCLVTRLIILQIIKILIIAIMLIIVIIITIVTNSNLQHDVKLGMEKCNIASVSKT